MRRKPIARVNGIDYLDLEQHLGYALRRAQVASFEAFSRATAGAGITPPRFTALVILQANPGISQSTLGEVLGSLDPEGFARAYLDPVAARAEMRGYAWVVPQVPTPGVGSAPAPGRHAVVNGPDAPGESRAHRAPVQDPDA